MFFRAFILHQPSRGEDDRTTTGARKMLCPMSMCPLLGRALPPASDDPGEPCPGHANAGEPQGCYWWGRECQGGAVRRRMPWATLRGLPGASFDCPNAARCTWQREAGEGALCPPRDALRVGIDPTTLAFGV